MTDKEYNRVYLILGATSDLGIELITQLDKVSCSKDLDTNNHTLYIAHYNSSKEKLETISIDDNNTLICVKADLSNMNSVDILIEEVKKYTDAPTHIVHLAAEPFRYMKLKEFNRDTFIHGMDIQVSSFAKIMQAFLPVMAKRKQHDKIVVMLTSYLLNSSPHLVLDYVTIKAALYGLVRSLATDYLGKCVNINTVSPSMIETKFLTNIDERIIQMVAENSPEKRNASPKDIVPVIQFLLSDAANYLHGANLNVTNGGII